MRSIVLLTTLATLLTASPAFSQPFPCEACPSIACGETKTIRSGEGHTLMALYTFDAMQGDVFSFESRDLVNDGSLFARSLQVSGTRVEFASDGRALVCSWEAPSAGEFRVFLEAGAVWGWNVTLTMHCGSGPPSCAVSTTAETWSQIKALFR